MALTSFLIITTLIFSNLTIMLAGTDSVPPNALNLLSGSAKAEVYSEAGLDDSLSIEPYQTRGESRPRLNAVTYAIITPGKFTDTLEPLAAWKTQKGAPSEIYNLSWITANYDGRDKAEKIHNFLVDLNWKSPQLTWLLLVGDSEIIPTRYILTNISENADTTDMDNFVASDYYYSGLGSNWDTDNDKIFGEPGEEDWTANVYVGRLPVNNLTEVNISVNKILDYELSPPIGAWSSTGLFCSALMDTPNIIDDPETVADDEGYNWYKDNAYEATQKILKYLPLDFEAIELTDYTETYGGNYDRLNDTLNYTSTTTKFNEGAAIVSFISHGWTNGDGVTHYTGNGISNSYTGYFNYDDAFYAQNGNKLPFIYSSSCSSGDFTEKDDTNFEQLLISPTGGAIGVIAATAFTYRGEYNDNDTSWGNWWLADHFWKNFFNGYPKPGENLYNLKEAYLQRINSPDNPHTSSVYFKMYRTNLLAYNLLGDPELSIFSDEIGEISASHPKDIEVITRATELEFEVKAKGTGKPLANALICLYGNGIYETVVTDKNGKAILDLNLVEPGTFNITITAQNFLPYESTIRIRNYIDLAINDSSLTFSKLNPAAGEDIVFSAEIQNRGQQEAKAVIVKFFDGYPVSNVTSGNQIGNNKTIDAGPGEAVNVTLNWVMPTGAHAVYVVVDHDDLILETDEDNNLGFGVITENIPPKFSNLPDISIEEDTIIYNALNLSIYAWDPDTTELEFTILENTDPNCNVSINPNNYFDIIPESNWHGKSTVTVQVYDGASEVIDSIIIYVSPVNDQPELEALVILEAKEDEPFKYQFEASDIDSETLFFQDNTELFEIDNTMGLISFVPSNDDVGSHNITITVSDGETNTTGTILLNVTNVNDAPEFKFNTMDWQATADKQFNYKVTATDIDLGDTLVFSDDSKLFEIDPNTGEIAFKPDQNDVGKHRITISVSDGNITIDQDIILTIDENPTGPGTELVVVGAIGIILVFIILYILYRRIKKDKTEEQ